MNFEPTEIQQMLKDSVGRLMADSFDFHARREQFVSPGGAREQWDELGALGLTGILVEERHGGAGGGMHDLAAALESLGAAMVIEPLVPSAVVGAGLIERGGTDRQREELLPRIATGTTRTALAATERGSRFRLDRVETIARPDNGGIRLSGHKTLVQGGGGADLLIVSARDVHDRLSLYLVPKEADGLDVTPYRNLDLGDAADAVFEDVLVPAEALLGPAGGALPLLEWVVDRAAAAHCCEAVGAMQALVDLTLEQLRTRKAFGRLLGNFQVLQHRIVDMIVAVELARSMAMLAADKADAADAAERTRSVSAAKVQIGRSARFVGEQAMQLHGAMAITLEHPVGYFHKRLAVIDHLHGDMEHHLERFADASDY